MTVNIAEMKKLDVSKLIDVGKGFVTLSESSLKTHKTSVLIEALSRTWMLQESLEDICKLRLPSQWIQPHDIQPNHELQKQSYPHLSTGLHLLSLCLRTVSRSRLPVVQDTNSANAGSELRRTYHAAKCAIL